MLFSVEGVFYNMKTRDHLAKLREVVNSLDSLQIVVIIPFINRYVAMSFDISQLVEIKTMFIYELPYYLIQSMIMVQLTNISLLFLFLGLIILT